MIVPINPVNILSFFEIWVTFYVFWKNFSGKYFIIYLKIEGLGKFESDFGFCGIFRCIIRCCCSSI